MAEVYIELGGKNSKTGYFTRNRIYPISEARQKIQAMRNLCNNKDVYCCTYMFNDKKREKGTKYLSPLYFDIDGDISTDESFQLIREAVLSLTASLYVDLGIRQNEIRYYFSGSKGFHVIIAPSVVGMQWQEDLNEKYKVIVSYLKSRIKHGDLIDTRIYDNKRLIRLPNSINAKTGLYKIPVSYETIRTVNRQDILEMAKTPKQEPQASNQRNDLAAKRIQVVLQKAPKQRQQRHTTITIPKEVQKLPICMRYILETKLAQGSRNNTAAVIASVLIQNGYNREQAEHLLFRWNENNEPPLPDREILRTYLSAERMIREGKRYGCAAIRALGEFAPREVCPHCRIYRYVQGNNQRRIG